MSEGGPVPAADSTGPKVRTKPPWWLITSWGRWVFWTVIYPALMSVGPVERWREGRSNGIDAFLVIALAGLMAQGLVQLVLTLRAYRRDPGLRTREWPSATPGPRLSRQVTFLLTTLAIAAVGLLLLVYTGWGPALFVAVVLAGSALTIRHFDLFGDADPAGQQAGRYPRPRADEVTPDR